jgi:NADH pyrophosphatase NudC (nudix superfamily)
MDTDTTADQPTDQALAEWLATQTWSEFATSLAEYHGRKGYLTPKQRNAAISMMDKIKSRDAAAEAVVDDPSFVPVVEAGVYEKEGVWYRVRWNSRKTNLYAQEIVTTPLPLVDDKPQYRVSFRFAKGIVGTLSATDRATAAQAKDFGKAYGACIFCGATLSTVESVEAGYGPVCAQHNHLPWGNYDFSIRSES